MCGASDQTCSNCGGVIRGRIRDFRDHLIAEKESLHEQLEFAAANSALQPTPARASESWFATLSPAGWCG